jgi:hypothetical protein
LVIAMGPLATVATTPEQQKAARDHYDDAVAHYNLEEYSQAAEEFLAVYKAAPLPQMLYNVAQSYRFAGDLPRALVYYKSYLRTVKHASERKEVEKRIRVLEAQIARGETRSPAPAPSRAAAPAPPAAASGKANSAPGELQPTARNAPAAGSDRLAPLVELFRGKRVGFRACYDAWSKQNPGVGGKVTLSLFLNPEGGLDRADAVAAGFSAPDVISCITNFAATLEYPASPGGKFTRVTYPLDFKPL